MIDRPDPSVRLDVQAYTNATVVATTPYPRPSRKNARKMGVLDSKGKVVRASQLWRSYGRMGFPPDPTSAPSNDSREVIYAGHLPPHFGHFILEGLSRLWFAAAHPDLPIVWACRADDPVSEYTRWQHEILEVLGIRNPPVFVAAPTRFARVHVPEAGFRIKDFFSDQLARFLAVYPSGQRDPGRKVWLSRAGVEAEHASVYAGRLDQQLAEHGWGVIHPQRLPIAKQLELLATASHVAAEEGSALHLLVLLADVSGLEVDILSRRPDRPAGRQNANYQTIATARGFTQRIHVIPEERVTGVGLGHVTKVATTLAGHLEALGVPRDDDRISAARPLGILVSGLAAGAASYLELGTGPDPIYPSVEVPIRQVVRPAFGFDPRQRRGQGLELFEMPFDEFFDYCTSPEQHYDVILLDGFRTDGELRRWFEATRRHAHAGTTWVIAGPKSVVDGAGQMTHGLASRLESTAEGHCLVVSAGSGPGAPTR